MHSVSEVMLSPADYELYVMKFLSKLGHTEIKLTGGIGDHGVDIVSRMPDGRVAVTQVKMYDHPVEEGIVRELLGSKQFAKAEHAILITSSKLTSSARNFALSEGIEFFEGVKPESNSASSVEDVSLVETAARQFMLKQHMKSIEIESVFQSHKFYSSYIVVATGYVKTGWFKKEQRKIIVRIDDRTSAVKGYRWLA